MNLVLDPSRASVNTTLTWNPAPYLVTIRRLIPSGGYVNVGEFPVPDDPNDLVELIRLTLENPEFTANFSQVGVNEIVHIAFLIGNSQSRIVRLQLTRKPTSEVSGLCVILE